MSVDAAWDLRLRQLGAELLDLVEQADVNPPTEPLAQVEAWAFADALAQGARALRDELADNFTKTRRPGARVEAGPWVVKVEGTASLTKWKNDDLRRDLRAKLLTNPDGTDRTAAELLDALWDDEDGLAPLVGGHMRRTVFATLDLGSLDQYATVKTGKRIAPLVDPRKAKK